MIARFFCRFGQLAGSEYEIGLEATIGSGSENDVVLSAPSISSRQARVVFDEDAQCYFLEDLSGGGTALDGQPVEGRMELSSVHVITFAGEHDFFFHWNPLQLPQEQFETVDLRDLASQSSTEPSAPQTSPRSSQEPAPPPPFQAADPQQEAASSHKPQSSETTFRKSAGVALPDFLKPGRQPPDEQSPDIAPQSPIRLVLEVEIPDGTKTYPLKEGENLIGRSSNCQVFVDDPTLSRSHAVLTVDSGTVKVRDLGSTNRTLVEGKAISQETEIDLETPIAFAKLSAKVRLEEA